MPMNKTIFEKLTSSEVVSLKQSVINNIDRILSAGSFLDGDAKEKGDLGQDLLNGFFKNGLPAIVDQAVHNGEQIHSYSKLIEKILLRFEPRLVRVKVKGFVNQGLKSFCRLRIELVTGEFEED